MELGATILAYLAAGIVKPAVMIISTVLLIRMIRAYRTDRTHSKWFRIEDDQRPAFRMILFSMILFVLSELFCGIETYGLMRSDDTLQILHSISSATGMGLFAVGIYMLLDGQVIHFGTGRCVMKPVCHACSYGSRTECKFTPLFVTVFFFIVLVSVLPMLAPTNEMNADSARFVLPFEQANLWYDKVLLPWMMSVCPHYRPVGDAVHLQSFPQIIDYRLFPLISISLIVSGLIRFRSNVLTSRPMGLYLIMFAAGLLGYTYYQLVLQRGTGDLFMAALGHEIGELFFLVVLIKLLNVFFPLRDRNAPA